MPAISARSRRQSNDYWPGFVDALAALLMVVVFLILIFALAQIFLSDALSDRGAALDRLTRQADEFGQLLALERGANADLRLSVAQLSAELQSSLAERESLSTQFGSLIDRNDVLLSEREALDQRLAEIRAELSATTDSRDDAVTEAEQVRAELVDAFTVISADKETIELQLRDLESLRRDIAALGQVREELERQVADLDALSRDQATQIANLGTEGQQLRDRSKALEARLADEQERTSLAQRDLEERDIRLAELLQRAEGAEAIYSEAEAQIVLLNNQLLQLRTQIAALSEILEATESKNEDQQTQIVDLGRRLNQALAARVQELAEYRSEFFGRLRQVLGERDDIRIVGDRFVFQSEVLFRTAAAELESGGRDQLGRFAATLRELSTSIPDDIDWVLRVDGHTDSRPIRTAVFPSNWELSSARALSVVRFLVDQGIPANRLVAAGFGQFHPLDARFDEDAYSRNRRIEFKLTQR